MTSEKLMWITAIMLVVAWAVPVRLVGQRQQQDKQQPRYKLVDIGTLGGPNSYSFNGERLVNGRGVVTGIADTSIPDPFSPNCFEPECLVVHTFQWKNGVLTDLGALVEGVSSGPNWINSDGVVAGISENGMTDSSSVFPPEYDAVVWKDGHIKNLGTFGGNWSYANAINDAGQVVGFALNNTPDSFDLGDQCENFPFPTQMHAFLWQGGALEDLGTLGTGTDSCALFVNQSGQAAGHSFTNTVVNSVTGLPTVDPFLWNGKKLVDLGTLGGNLGRSAAINNRGDVVGQSNLSGDVYFHPFVWIKHGPMLDLGTFGGNFGSATFINDAGQVVGFATNAGDQAQFAFLWNKGGLTNLGTVDGDPCSFASGINSESQIIGTSGSCDFSVAHGFLKQNGRMADLNTLIRPRSDLILSFPAFIDDRGEITGTGVLPNGDLHAFLLIPCGEGDNDCEGGNLIGATQSSSSAVSQRGLIPDWFRARLARKNHFPGAALGQRSMSCTRSHGEADYITDNIITDVIAGCPDPTAKGGRVRGVGRCSVSAEGLLTGTCAGPNFGHCSSANDLTNCPKGTRACGETRFMCGNEEIMVDAKRTCNP